MSNKLSNFESSVKDTLNDFEMPFEPSSWDRLESQLDESSKSNSSNLLSTLFIAASFVILVGSIFYFGASSFGTEGLSAEKTFMMKRNSTSSEFNTNKIAAIGSSEESNSNQDLLDQTSSLNIEEIDSKRVRPFTTSTKITVEERNSDSPLDEASLALEEPLDDSQLNSLDNNDKNTEADGMMLVSSIREACVGVSVDFNLSSTDINGKYLWNFGDGNFSSKANPSHTFNKPGEYDISLSVTSDTDGVIHSKVMKNMIVINPVPEADFEWEFVNEYTSAPTVQFKNNSHRATESEWIFDDKHISTEINPDRVYEKVGKHVVKLTTTNEYGCVDTKYNYITIDDNYNLMAPASFSPNGDGNADTFMPEALKKNNQRFKLTVYNNSQPIFETRQHKVAWDGMMPDSTLATKGDSFPWVVIIYNSEGEEENYYSGTITIIP